MLRTTTFLTAALALATLTAPAGAFDFNGQKRLTLETIDGQSIEIGSVTFIGKGGTGVFRTAVDTARFKDFFLSMREFKCLEDKEIFCHVPYPYRNPGSVAADNFGWLEASLIFMFKTPSQFGATLANGLVYELKEEGDALIGAPRLVDLNEIAAPPDDPSKPPFPPHDRLDVEPGARWITRLVIR